MAPTNTAPRPVPPSKAMFQATLAGPAGLRANMTTNASFCTVPKPSPNTAVTTTASATLCIAVATVSPAMPSTHSTTPSGSSRPAPASRSPRDPAAQRDNRIAPVAVNSAADAGAGVSPNTIGRKVTNDPNPVEPLIMTSHGRQFDRAVSSRVPAALPAGRTIGNRASATTAAMGSAPAMANTGPNPQLFASKAPAASPTSCGQPTATPYQAEPRPRALLGNSSAINALPHTVTRPNPMPRTSEIARIPGHEVASNSSGLGSPRNRAPMMLTARYPHRRA